MLLRPLVILLLGGCLLASAQSVPSPAATRLLSLQECLDLALGRNFDIKVSQLSADVARYQLNGSYGAYDPTFSFSARHDFVSQPPDFDPKKTGVDSPYELDGDTIGPELKGNLPFGLSYDLLASGGFHRASTDLSAVSPKTYPNGIRITNNFDSAAALQLKQNLLKDFWIDQASENLRLRRADLKISEQTLKFQIMRSVLAVELAYYDLQAARDRIRVSELAVQLKQQLVSETKRRVEVGDLPPLDAEQAETQLQNALTALTAARENYFTQQNSLKGMITDNFREWVGFELIPADNLAAVKQDVNRAESFEHALRNRPDLIEARLNVDKRDIAVKFGLNQLFPSLDLIGEYGGLGVQPDFRSAASDVINFRHPVYYYGVVFSVPLGSVAERNNYKASKTQREIAKLQLKQAEEGVLLQIAEYVNRVESRYSQVQSTRQARRFAETALAAEQKKLENGLTTAFTVLQYQEILTTAQTAEVAALADYNKSIAQLSFADGSTLEKHHLKVQPNRH